MSENEKKLEKKPQNSIATTEIASKEIDFLRDFRIPFKISGGDNYGEDALKSLAEKIIAWSKSSEEIYIFKKILNIQNTKWKSFNQWCKRCPELMEAKEIAMQRIAVNREQAALAKDPSGIAFKHMQGTYDPEWGEREIYFNQLKENIAGKSQGNLVAVLRSAEDFERIDNERKEKGLSNYEPDTSVTDATECGGED